MIECPECASDDLTLVADLDDGTKRILCNVCGHEWVRGEPKRMYRNADSFEAIKAKFPSALNVSEPARNRAEELKRQFLHDRPDPDPRVAARWAELRDMFSEDHLDDVDPAEFKRFANENLGANPGNMSVFNNAWNQLGEVEAAQRVRDSLRYLLYPKDQSYIEDRLTRLITGGNDFGMTGFREALLTKVLCIVYPQRFLPIVTYSGAGGGKKELAKDVYQLVLPAPSATSWTIGRLAFWSNDLLVELLGEGFTDLQHGAQFLWAVHVQGGNEQ